MCLVLFPINKWFYLVVKEDHLEMSIPKDKLHSSPNVVTFLLLAIYDMQEISAAVSAMATLLQNHFIFM